MQVAFKPQFKIVLQKFSVETDCKLFTISGTPNIDYFKLMECGKIKGYERNCQYQYADFRNLLREMFCEKP